jgi:2'-5' RNA ligase
LETLVQHTTETTQTLLRNHWKWRPDWAVDRPYLLWYLTFESQPDLVRTAQHAQARLRGLPPVDVVPLPWLHLTLDDVGFADEVAPAQVEEVVESSRSALAGWTPPPLTLGPLAPMEDAVVLLADPVAEIEDLRDRLRGAITAVLGPDRMSGMKGHRPHVTLAYLNDDCDYGTVMGPLEPVSSEKVVVAVPRVTLASVTRRDRHYQWTTRAEVTLGA